jgi:hypothetical protein
MDPRVLVIQENPLAKEYNIVNSFGFGVENLPQTATIGTPRQNNSPKLITHSPAADDV